MCNVWSPPECLKVFKKILDPIPPMDSYSFGIILWELWHLCIPFEGDLLMAIKYVVDEDSRPMISVEEVKCNNETALLIR